ncbi:acyl-CoA synthetase [Acidisphaera sp. L21]|uniref:acyl-CoA synthetase n=1 Tax=Acidisphaera sp. L21 TaxID=1641851 RepID=UPI00131DDD06|nr:acyl-CoA synthetase [Acidisphaera sp. L21]
MSPYDLPKNAANHVPLSPISFLIRAAAVHPDRLAVVHGAHRATWRQTAERCRRLASALAQRGIGKGDTVAVMAPNTPPTLEAHFAVPMLGAVLNALNIRLDAETIAYILGHGEARVLITDREFAPTIAAALALLPAHARPLVIDIDDPLAPPGDLLGDIEYEAFLASGDPHFPMTLPGDEWDAIALNYTSGTTGRPKGVITHHRGAYLNALGNLLTWAAPHFLVYLWTLPMFHCNGWCFPWAITAHAGTHVCLRRADAASILHALDAEGITHMCGAPIIMGMIVNAPGVQPRPTQVHIMTAGAAPPAAIIEGMEKLNFAVTHVYGLTECYGPNTVCEWHTEWDALPAAEQATLKARQGVPYVVQEALMVADPTSMVPVPKDGATMGELMMRGNVLMKGYLKDDKATAAAFEGGWFHTGDLGVWHNDGYAEIRDRAKDIIISGGENISTIEVESVLYRHPAVLEAAVVARPDVKWGETPCAFVTLKPGIDATEADIIAFCRQHMAHYKAPRTVVFGPLPKTSTGKMQKFLLRDRARVLA